MKQSRNKTTNEIVSGKLFRRSNLFVFERGIKGRSYKLSHYFSSKEKFDELYEEING